jgi:hypothetical protein
MSEYTSGGNTSSETESTDSEPQTTSDSDGSDSVDTPAASLEVTPHPHEVDVSVRGPATTAADGLYKLFLHSDRVSGSVFLTRGDCLALADELQDATSDPDGSNGDARPDRDEHLGAVEIDVSDQVTGFHYDDEPDSVVVTSSDGDTIRVSPEEARSLVGDMTAALDAIATERDADR